MRRKMHAFEVKRAADWAAKKAADQKRLLGGAANAEATEQKRLADIEANNAAAERRRLVS